MRDHQYYSITGMLLFIVGMLISILGLQFYNIDTALMIKITNAGLAVLVAATIMIGFNMAHMVVTHIKKWRKK